MSEQSDPTYYVTRAETERAMANNATLPQVAAVHFAMAELYEALETGTLALFPTPNSAFRPIF